MQTTLVCQEQAVASGKGGHSPSKVSHELLPADACRFVRWIDLQRDHLGNLIATVR
jgi:hypothetical protein